MNPTTNSLSTAEHGAAVVSSSPDIRLGNRVRKALDTSAYAPISSLQCRVDDGVVTLSGVVTSYYLKQVAQETARRMGASRIENRVKVVYR